jgi:hypothetical protein
MGDVLGRRRRALFRGRWAQVFAVGVKLDRLVDEIAVEPVAARIGSVFLSEVAEPDPAPGVAVAVKLAQFEIVESGNTAGLDLVNQ